MASVHIIKGKGNPHDHPNPCHCENLECLPDEIINRTVKPAIEKGLQYVLEGYNVVVTLPLSPKYCLYNGDKEELADTLRDNDKIASVDPHSKGNTIIAWTKKDQRLKVIFAGANVLKRPLEDSVEVVQGLTQDQRGVDFMYVG